MASTLRRLRTLLVILRQPKATPVAISTYLLGIIWFCAAYWLLARDVLSTGSIPFEPITLAGFGGGMLPVLYTVFSGHRPATHSGALPHRPRRESAEAVSGAAVRVQVEPLPTSPPDLRGERKRVTVMFADLCDSTSMAQAMDPEEMRDLINSCFERMVPVVTEYGGTVNTFLGDGILALFGAPVAHENDPERCLRAALRMQEVLASFTAERGTSVKMHFGINTGLVVAGGVGSRGRHDYGVTGDVVNLAARLEDASGKGEILVGPETCRLTRHLFEFQPTPSLQIKGRTEPVPAFKLLGTRAQPVARWQPELRGVSAPLVGRSREFTLAREYVVRLRSGQGGILSIVGDAGLGKSRFIAELRQLADELGVCWLESGAPSAGQRASYWPFIEMIRADSGITVGDPEEDETWKKLEKRINEICPSETEDLLPYLASLLNADPPSGRPDRLKHLDGEAMGRQLFRSTRRFFSSLAETRPLALALEDIHWLDESSLQLLEHLLPLCREFPLLMILSSRPNQSGALERMRLAAEGYSVNRYAEVRLSPLSPSDTTQLMRNLINAHELPFGLRDIVLRKAGGNPLFVEEVIRASIDLGGLKHDEATGRWKTTEQMERIPIPDTLAGVIAARIDRLSGSAKEVLKLASVIGRTFQRGVLEGIAELHQELDEGLQELLILGLVSEVRHHPEPEYLFKHALVQEATYESILLRRRQGLHRRVAEYIETTFADHLDEVYGLIAYHYTKAEVWAKAQKYLLKAGDQAGRIAADAEALDHYQQALAAYGRAFGDSWDPMERATLENNVGEALFRRGEHGHGRRHLEQALTALGQPYPTSSRGVRLALLREIASQTAHRLLPGLLVRPAKLHVARRSEELSHQYETLKWMDFFLDGERCLLSTLLLLNQAERTGYVVGMVKASSGIGVGLDAIGLRRFGDFYCRRAAKLANETREPWLMGDPYTLLGIHEEYTMGRTVIAREDFDRGAQGYWESGSIKGWAAATTLAGRSMARLGDIPGAMEMFRRVGQVAVDAAEHQAQGWGLSFEGEMLEVTGQFEEASSRLLHAIELFREVPDHLSTALAHGLLSRCYMRSRRLSESRQLLAEARRSIVERGLGGFMCSPVWLGLAEVDLALAEQASGAARKDALAQAQQSAEMALKQGRVDVQALAPGFRVRGSLDYLRGRVSSAREWWQRSLQDAETRGMRYELGMTHLEIGKRTGDRAHLERAEFLFAGMGAQFDLDQTREQLKLMPVGLVA